MSNSNIVYLSDYNWLRCVLVKVNAKSYKLLVPSPSQHTKNVPKDKCAFPDEKVCVVWNQSAGVNGRGSYRVERILYPSDRIAASIISRQHDNSPGSGRVDEP
jgi:hypothetical protein